MLTPSCFVGSGLWLVKIASLLLEFPKSLFRCVLEVNLGLFKLLGVPAQASGTRLIRLGLVASGAL